MELYSGGSRVVAFVASAVLASAMGVANGQTPIAQWKLNETSGTIAVDGIGGFNGTYQAGATPGAGTPFLDGSPTARFDGISGFVLLPPSSAFRPKWKKLTVEAWVHLDATPATFAAILSPPDHGFVHFQAGAGGNSVIYTTVVPPVGIDLPVYSIPDLLGQWHHVALVAESGDNRVYLDGVRYGYTNTAKLAAVAQSPTNLRIGGGFDPSRFWNGSLANVALFKTALSDAQILARYQAGSTAGEGTVTGLSSKRVVCVDLTTGARVVIQDHATTWNCEQQGLVVNAGDRIQIDVRDTAD